MKTKTAADATHFLNKVLITRTMTQTGSSRPPVIFPVANIRVIAKRSRGSPSVDGLRRGEQVIHRIAHDHSYDYGDYGPHQSSQRGGVHIPPARLPGVPFHVAALVDLFPFGNRLRFRRTGRGGEPGQRNSDEGNAIKEAVNIFIASSFKRSTDIRSMRGPTRVRPITGASPILPVAPPIPRTRPVLNEINANIFAYNIFPSSAATMAYCAGGGG